MTEIINESSLQEYEDFIAAHPKGHFAQSSLWAKQKPQWKWVAVASRGEDGKINGAMSALIRKVPMTPFTLMYACRAPVCDIHDRETIKQLCLAMKDIAKKHKSYELKMDPDVPSSDKVFREIMSSLGFKISEEGKNFEAVQPRYVFRLYLDGRNEEQVMASFHQKTRYNIRVAVKKGVTVRLCGQEAVPDFARLMLETGVRDGFVTRQEGYFADMLKNMGEHARLYMAYTEEGLPVAGTLAIAFGDKVWYLYGASSNEHRNLMPNYLLQWEMIKWAIELGARVYDFRGVSGDLSEDNPLYGLYKFKKGFNGEFTEFIGEMDLIFNPAVDAFVRHGGNVFKEIRKRLYLLKNRT